jgi:hypothetical protein
MTLRGRDLCHDSDEVHPVDLDVCLMDTVKVKQPLYVKILSFLGAGHLNMIISSYIVPFKLEHAELIFKNMSVSGSACKLLFK